MILATGARLGVYEITGELGAGGMGEVYRATDTTLEREVAIKVLPESVASDAKRIARFEQEAKTLASLNHPNIAQIFGLERSDGTTALVLELVEGPTLADRIAEGPIPPDEALGIAMQIADALEAAHGRQIVHRDLKPANIKLRPDGTVKALDFGIAKALETKRGASGAQTPSLTTPAMTQAGILLGTAAYMSPEQARGKTVDQRADIWAFGCVVYEMLTGQPAFAGNDVSTTLARVLEREVDVSLLPARVSPAVCQTVKLCFQKDIRKRVRDIGDVKLALEGAFDPGFHGSAEDEAVIGSRGRRGLALVAATAIVMTLIAGLGAWILWPRAQPRLVNRFDFALPKDQPFRESVEPVMALSPDGRRVVYNATGGLYLRPMDQLGARLIPGTEEELSTPIFSPDGQSVAYFAVPDRLKRIAISGGAPVVIAEHVGFVYGMSWNPDGTILYGQPQGVFRVSSNGGAPELVIPAKKGWGLYGPQLLPDGNSVLFSATTNGKWDEGEVFAQSLSTGKRTVLVNGGSDAHYMATGQLIYAVGNKLFAVSFDAGHLTVSGPAVRVLSGITRSVGNITATANYAVSSNGTLAYVSGSGGASATGSYVWVDAGGRKEPLGLAPCRCVNPDLSPDGTRVALARAASASGLAGADIWVWSLAKHMFTRLTFDPGIETSPLWTPDGTRIAYATAKGISWRRANGTGMAETLVEGNSLVPWTWTAGGDLVFTDSSSGISSVSKVAVAGDHKRQAVLVAKFNITRPALSPDGHWLAYQSDEMGRYEIYVRPFPDVEQGKWQVSVGGGTDPQWAPDGRALFYLSPKSLMATTVEGTSAFAFGAPQAVVDRARYVWGETLARRYDVSADGQRFLLIKPGGSDAGAEPQRIIIVTNWLEELKRLVPTK